MSIKGKKCTGNMKRYRRSYKRPGRASVLPPSLPPFFPSFLSKSLRKTRLCDLKCNHMRTALCLCPHSEWRRGLGRPQGPPASFSATPNAALPQTSSCLLSGPCCVFRWYFILKITNLADYYPPGESMVSPYSPPIQTPVPGFNVPQNPVSPRQPGLRSIPPTPTAPTDISIPPTIYIRKPRPGFSSYLL